MYSTDEENREQYVATWRKAFEELLGSAEPYLARTIDHWKDWMLGDESKTAWFYHDTPLSYVVPELIPRTLRPLLDAYQCMRLEDELHSDGLGCCR